MASTLIPGGSVFFLFTKSQHTTDAPHGQHDDHSNTPSLMPSKAHSPPIALPSEHRHHAHRHHEDSALRPSVYRKILQHRKQRKLTTDSTATDSTVDSVATSTSALTPTPGASERMWIGRWSESVSQAVPRPLPRKRTVFTDLSTFHKQWSGQLTPSLSAETLTESLLIVLDLRYRHILDFDVDDESVPNRYSEMLSDDTFRSVLSTKYSDGLVLCLDPEHNDAVKSPKSPKSPESSISNMEHRVDRFWGSLSLKLESLGLRRLILEFGAYESSGYSSKYGVKSMDICSALDCVQNMRRRSVLFEILYQSNPSTLDIVPFGGNNLLNLAVPITSTSNLSQRTRTKHGTKRKKAMFNAPPIPTLCATASMVERTLEELSTPNTPSMSISTNHGNGARKISESKTDDEWMDEAVHEMMAAEPGPLSSMRSPLRSPSASPPDDTLEMKPRLRMRPISSMEIYDQIKRAQSKQNENDTHCLVLDALAVSHSSSPSNCNVNGNGHANCNAIDLDVDCEQLVIGALAEVDELDHRPWPQPLQWQQRSDSLLDSETWWVSEIYNRSNSRRSSASFDIDLLFD